MTNWECYYGTPERTAKTVDNIVQTVLGWSRESERKQMELATVLYAPENHLEWLQKECE